MMFWPEEDVPYLHVLISEVCQKLPSCLVQLIVEFCIVGVDTRLILQLSIRTVKGVFELVQSRHVVEVRIECKNDYVILNAYKRLTSGGVAITNHLDIQINYSTLWVGCCGSSSKHNPLRKYY